MDPVCSGVLLVREGVEPVNSNDGEDALKKKKRTLSNSLLNACDVARALLH